MLQQRAKEIMESIELLIDDISESNVSGDFMQLQRNEAANLLKMASLRLLQVSRIAADIDLHIKRKPS
jgi:hypothetical protein